MSGTIPTGSTVNWPRSSGPISAPSKMAMRSALRILPDLVPTGRRLTGKRVWILVMDGMRYDTWDAVVRPLLGPIISRWSPASTGPTSASCRARRTSRSGLLAAGLAKDWKNHSGYPTKDERVLAARALGIAKHEIETTVRFVTEAETTQARAKMGDGADDLRDINALIYPISDDLGYHHNDTLASLNGEIRSQLVSRQGMRGIVEDLAAASSPPTLCSSLQITAFRNSFRKTE